MQNNSAANDASTTSAQLEQINSEFEPKIKNAPEDSNLWNDWGFKLTQIGAFDEAEQKFRKAHEHGANDVGLYSNWGATLKNLNRFDEAEEKFNTANEIDETHPLTYKNWGNLKFVQASYEKAIEKYKLSIKYLQSKTEKSGVYISWADALVNLGKKEEALDTIEKAYEISSDQEYNQQTEDILLTWGNIYYDLTFYEKALQKYEEILLNNENSLNAIYNSGLCYFYQNKFEDASEKFRTAVKLDPDNVSYHTWLADSLMNQKDIDAAEIEYEKAISLEHDNAAKGQIYYSWGFFLLKHQKSLEALEKLSLAEEWLTNEPYLYLYFGNAYHDISRFKAAEEKYKKALDLAKANYNETAEFSIRISLGTLYLFKKRFSDAKINLERAIDIDEDHPLIYYYLGSCFHQTGRYSEAHKAWETSRVKFQLLDQKNLLYDNKYSCYIFARILHYVYGELTEARDLYQFAEDEINEIDKIDLLRIYLELSEFYPKDFEDKYHFSMLDVFSEIERSLKNELNEWAKTEAAMQPVLANDPNYDTEEIGRKNREFSKSYNNFYLGVIYYEVGFYENALEYFKRADRCNKAASDQIEDRRKSQVEINNALGICYSQLGEHKNAIKCLELAKFTDPQNLDTRTNLARSYLAAFNSGTDSSKSRNLESAEKELESILFLAPNNVDAVTGLGNTKLTKSEFRKQDFYDEAIESFRRVLDLSAKRIGSDRLTKKNKTAILYNLGYAHIKKYESNKSVFKEIKDDSLAQAKYWFKETVDNDKKHKLAKQAFRYLNKTEKKSKEESYIEKLSPLIIGSLAILTFVLSLTSFFWKKPLDDINSVNFIALAFGSLTFLIVAFSLPLISKFKFANIEMEKEIEKSIPISEDFSFLIKQDAGTNFSQLSIAKHLIDGEQTRSSGKDSGGKNDSISETS